MTALTKTCAQCGKPFPKPLRCSAANWARREVCSYGCANKRRAGKARLRWTDAENAVIRDGIARNLSRKEIRESLPGRSGNDVRRKLEYSRPGLGVYDAGTAACLDPAPRRGQCSPAEVRRLAAKGVPETQIAALLRVPYRAVSAALRGEARP